jgi:hypothetical protein
VEALVKALVERIACRGRKRSDLVFLLFVADELLDLLESRNRAKRTRRLKMTTRERFPGCARSVVRDLLGSVEVGLKRGYGYSRESLKSQDQWKLIDCLLGKGV